MQVDYSEHGILRACERGGFLTRQTARYQIRRAWVVGVQPGYGLFHDQWAGFEYRYLDGLIYVFRTFGPGQPPLHLTVLLPDGQQRWQVRAA